MGGIARINKGRIFYVYVLLDTRKPINKRYSYWKFTYEPFYIGKGHGNRVFHHLSQSPQAPLTKGSTFRAKLARKILREGYEIGYRILRDNMSERSAFELEKYLISNIGRRDRGLGPLTNVTDGGEGDPGHIVTEEARDRIRKATIKQFASKEAREKHGEISKERHLDRVLNRPRVEEERCRKIGITIRNKSMKEKEEIRKKKNLTRALNGRPVKEKRVLTVEERTKNELLRRERISASLKNRTEEELEIIAAKRRISMKLTIDKRTEKQKQVIRDKISLAHQRRSNEEKETTSNLLSTKRRNYLNSLTFNQRSAIALRGVETRRKNQTVLV